MEGRPEGQRPAQDQARRVGVAKGSVISEQ
jgi:hypothetical protein